MDLNSLQFCYQKVPVVFLFLKSFVKNRKMEIIWMKTSSNWNKFAVFVPIKHILRLTGVCLTNVAAWDGHPMKRWLRGQDGRTWSLTWVREILPGPATCITPVVAWVVLWGVGTLLTHCLAWMGSKGPVRVPCCGAVYWSFRAWTKSAAFKLG